MTLPEVSVWYALVVLVGMGGGIALSGRLLDRFTRRSRVAYALIPALSLALAVAPYVGFVQAASWPVALAFLLGPTFLNYFYLSSCVALVQEEVAPGQRVLSGALLLLVMNLVGMGVGPTFVGAVSQAMHAAHPAHSLQIAFLALLPVYALAVALFLALAAVLRAEDRQRQRSPT